MAIWKHIIADSGGSTTNWAFCSADGTTTFSETPGMHPKVVFDWQASDWEKLREQLGNIAGETLYFYGAGCAQPETQEKMGELFRSIGMEEVHVFPDTLGACRAACGTTAGVVAILGTGSILVEYDGTGIVHRIGGYGSLIGDEGSGFHFARLVLRDYLNQASEMHPNLRKAVAGIVGEPSDVLKELASPSANRWIAQLGGRLTEPDLGNYHEQNLKAFLSICLTQVKSRSKTLNVVGSYGYYQQAMLCKLLEAKGWQSGAIIANPIKQLVEFHV